MKKYFLNLFAVTLVLISFLSCSNDNEIAIEELNKDQKIENVLNTFYNQDYSFGRVIDLSNENLIIKEVVVNHNLQRKGYVSISKEDGSLLYFADINEATGEVVAIDYLNNEKTVLNNFQVDDDGKSILNKDIIKDIKNNSSSSTSSKKFWGWSCGPTYPLEEGSCFRNCCYRVMGVVTNCDVYTCSNLPGSNPSLEP